MVDKKTIKAKLLDVMKKAHKAIIHTTSGYDASYASSLGKDCQSTYLKIDSYSDAELKDIYMMSLQYESILDSILAS